MTTVPRILVHDLPGSPADAEILALEVYNSAGRCDSLAAPQADGHRLPWRSGIYDPRENTVATVEADGTPHNDRSSVEDALIGLLAFAGQLHSGPVIVRLHGARTYVVPTSRPLPVFSVID